MAQSPRFRLLKECFRIHFFSVSSLSSVRVLYVQLAVEKPCCGAANKKYEPKMDSIENSESMPMYTESRITRNTALPSLWPASPPHECNFDESHMRTSNNQRRFAESDLTLVPVVPFLEGQFKSEKGDLVHLAHRLPSMGETTSLAESTRTTAQQKGPSKSENLERKHAHGGRHSPSLAFFSEDHAHPTTEEHILPEEPTWNTIFNKLTRSLM